MPAELTFYDAAYPPVSPPQTDGVAFYIGGDTPHVWDNAEVDSQSARYRLPVFVRSNPSGASASGDVAEAVARLRELSAPKGILVAWDMETAEAPEYIKAVYTGLTAAGYKLIVYGSQSDVFGNVNPDGLYWGADWTNRVHISGGDVMTQFISTNAYDESVGLSTLPFWDTRGGNVPPSPGQVTEWEKIVAALPTLSSGATGTAVRTVQGLCCARGHLTAIDGSFGPQTTLAVEGVQQAAKISADGVVGPETWPVLMGV